MDNNMVLSYDYAKQNRWRWRTNAPPLRTMLMAMVRRWSNTCGIARCSMSRATPEATGRRHRVTTRSVSPWRPPGRQQTKQWYIMYPLWWPFRWSTQCSGTIQHASPDGGGPGLSYTPLNTAIGWALAPIGQLVIAMLGFGLIFEVRGVGDGAMWVDKVIFT
jgi:hypothetical protein